MELIVRAVDIRAGELQAGVGVCGRTIWIGSGWTLVSFTGGVEH